MAKCWQEAFLTLEGLHTIPTSSKIGGLLSQKELNIQQVQFLTSSITKWHASPTESIDHLYIISTIKAAVKDDYHCSKTTSLRIL